VTNEQWDIVVPGARDGIEITDAMIAAGVSALLSTSSFDLEEDRVALIFRMMMSKYEGAIARLEAEVS